MPTQQQLADILTKILPSNQFKQLLSKLGVFSLSTRHLRGDVNYGNGSTQAYAHMNTRSIRIDDMAREDQLQEDQLTALAAHSLSYISRIMFRKLLGSF